MSIERRRVMAVLGAEIVLTEASKGMPGAIAKAKEIAESNPSQYFMPGQFDNPANPEIHFKTTGPEIWDDCDGEIDVLVAGVGTGGTITGVSKELKFGQFSGWKIFLISLWVSNLFFNSKHALFLSLIHISEPTRPY